MTHNIRFKGKLTLLNILMPITFQSSPRKTINIIVEKSCGDDGFHPKGLHLKTERYTKQNKYLGVCPRQHGSIYEFMADSTTESKNDLSIKKHERGC